MPNVNLEFSPVAMIALNAIIALMMFGVSLELRADDFRRILRAPKAPAIGSMAGWMPVLGRAGYCAAKSALGQAFEVLRAELARDGIGLLMVYPSFLDTPIDRNALGADGKPAGHARSTIGKIRGADWMAGLILKALDDGNQRLFPDRGSWAASLLWRLAPGLYYRQMSRRFAGELDA